MSLDLVADNPQFFDELPNLVLKSILESVTLKDIIRFNQESS